MANLIVTFGRTLGGNLESASDARTEEIPITGGHEEGELTANGAEDVVTLYAPEDCWVSLSKAPDAEAADAGSNRRWMKEGWQRQYRCGVGTKVSVVAA